VPIERSFRDGHQETWWALEVIAGPYGPHRALRAVVVTTDPLNRPELTTWYLITHLPTPNTPRAASSGLTAASLADVVRLYGLRSWVEQSYKQVKRVLGWAQYQVRSDRAMRCHWTLVCCAFTFCWWQASCDRAADDDDSLLSDPATQPSAAPTDRPPPKNALPGSQPGLSWPLALRQVRAWLEPCIMLNNRYWQAFSPLHPPLPLQQLLYWLWLGKGINIYTTA
jgi:hypothetical protein